MKGIKFITLLTIVCAIVSLQTLVAQKSQFGLKGGATYYKATMSMGSFEQSTDPAIGFSGGLFAEIAISKNFSIQPEALFIQKNSSDDDIGDDNKGIMNYVDVPVLLKFNLPLENNITPFVNAGGYAGYLISASSKYGDESIDVTDEFNEINYGILAGAGVKFGSISIEARYDMGLANVYPDDSDMSEYFDGGLELKLSGLSAFISIGF